MPERKRPSTAPATLLAIAALTLIALLLRVYQLGRASLWFDELGVAMVIRSASFPSLIAGIKSHEMAMPLDYVVNWLSLGGCQSEACLRIPAVVWGTLTIPLSYLLFRRLADGRTALVGALLLAISPLHVHYSQELRFYAALVFFYVLSTLLLLQAIERPTLVRWAAGGLSLAVGAYFHIFVTLAALNALAWIAATWQENPRRRRILITAGITLALAGLAVLPGFLYFRSPVAAFPFTLSKVAFNIGIGLGWLPTLLFPINAGMVWYVLFFFLQCIGVFELIKNRRGKLLLQLAAVAVQAAMVILGNLVLGYDFRGRQILFLIPMVSLMAALGLARIIGQSAPHPAPTAQGAPFYAAFPLTSLTSAMLGIIFLAGFFGLQGYYQEERSNRREVCAQLVQRWKPGESIWTTPGWETSYFGYYLDLLGHPEITAALKGAAEIRLEPGQPQPACWITAKSPTQTEQTVLTNHGYRLTLVDNRTIPDSWWLWCRP